LAKPPDELLTTREAAALLGVGTTSIKRWADSGLLDCAKTPGGHRRFYRSAIEAMLRDGRVAGGEAPHRVADWANTLTERNDPAELLEKLELALTAAGSCWRLAEELGEVLVEIGRRWNVGDITVLQEHLASERLSRALASMAAGNDVPTDADSALLLAAEGEEHTLGLSLVELCLRSAGWICHWGGRNTPFIDVERYLNSKQLRMIGLSASSASTNRAALAEEAERFASLCRGRGVRLLLGGMGHWPEQPDYADRVRTFAELRRIVE
jgi:excisionase family DNA binding protein